MAEDENDDMQAGNAEVPSDTGAPLSSVYSESSGSGVAGSAMDGAVGGDPGASKGPAVITVSKESYVVGLFWQPLQDPEDPFPEIAETAEGVVEGANLYCIRTGGAPQYALGTAGVGGIRSGLKVAASAVADAFSDRPSSVAVFKVKEGWWFIAVRNDLILAEEDRLYTDENDAKSAFFAMMAVPDWGRKIAPPEWGLEDTTYIELEDILESSRPLRLSKLTSANKKRNMWIMIGVGAVVLIAGYSYISKLLEAPPPVIKPLPPRPPVVAAPPPPPPPPPPEGPAPWESTFSPVETLQLCDNAIQKFKGISVPGWAKTTIDCAQGIVSSDWKQVKGRATWFSRSLGELDLKGYTLSIADSGKSGRISATFEPAKAYASPPKLSGKDIRLEFTDIFETIGVQIALNPATEGEIIDPKNPNSPPRPRFFLFKYAFTTPLSPKYWDNVLGGFSALSVDSIRYNVETQNWSYEGRIYERRN